MSVCYIFTGGSMGDNDISTFSLESPDLIISADAGFLYAEKYGYKTDFLIGDFDTIGEIPSPSKVKEIVRFNREKDDTDTMLAIKLALEKGAKNIIIFGALGGRFDHTFANIQSLNYISENNAKGSIVSNTEYISAISPGEYKFPYIAGYSFSAFSLTDKAEGVYETGFKYPLDNATLTNSFPVGVCNEIIDDFGTFSFKKGKVLIVISKK